MRISPPYFWKEKRKYQTMGGAIYGKAGGEKHGGGKRMGMERR
jgi:hypothetical protein